MHLEIGACCASADLDWLEVIVGPGRVNHLEVGISKELHVNEVLLLGLLHEGLVLGCYEGCCSQAGCYGQAEESLHDFDVCSCC